MWKKRSIFSVYSKANESLSSIHIWRFQRSTALQRNSCHQFIFTIKDTKKGLVKKFYNFGVSILYSRVLELSTNIGSKYLLQNEHDSVACSLSLKKNLLTTAALDNIHCVKRVCIRSYSVRMRENKDLNNSEYRHFSNSD